VIRYALICEREHGFESWFRDGAAFEEQAAGGLLSCPSCGSSHVSKAIMAPRLARRDRAEEGAQPVALVSPAETELRTKLRDLRAELTRNADYVGPRFASEARSMHLGETAHRSIYGEATAEEARSLVEEGIEFHALPALPDDRN
jgi:hypothetical protein